MRLTSTRHIDKNAAHLSSAYCEKMRSALKVNRLQVCHAQVELVYQRSCLKSVAIALLTHALLCRPMQLAIDLRGQLIERALVAGPPSPEHFRNFLPERVLQADTQNCSGRELAAKVSHLKLFLPAIAS